MSELTNTSLTQGRWRLLATVSTAALLAASYFGGSALAEDGDRPTVWIELGGQLERVDGGQEPFAPAFFDAISQGGLESPLAIDRPARYSDGIEGKISFLPRSSDWVFSASVRYGRSNGNKLFHQQPDRQTTRFPFFGKYLTKTAPPNYEETTTRNSESHLVADFQAGRDVGLGMFGGDSSSTLSLGVRFAQFSSKSNTTIRARPDVHFVEGSIYGYRFPLNFYHEYFASIQRAASFHGIGPSISWTASAPIVGKVEAGQIAFDWGINAALLFGRQKARTHHQSSGSYRYYPPGDITAIAVVPLPTNHGTGNRSHSVVVPNVGGFAGISFRYDAAKVSFGYRADLFLGAMDQGLDARRSYNRDFYGPFATVSIGLGG